jgi:hypothetical protein
MIAINGRKQIDAAPIPVIPDKKLKITGGNRHRRRLIASPITGGEQAVAAC